MDDEYVCEFKVEAMKFIFSQNSFVPFPTFFLKEGFRYFQICQVLHGSQVKRF